MSTETDELETIYRPNLTWQEFFKIFPNIAPAEYSKIKMIRMFERDGFLRPESIMDLSVRDLEGIDGLSQIKARKLYEFIIAFKKNGKITWKIDDLQQIESRIETISSGSDDLNKALPGEGFETQSIYELVSDAGMGKTQLCITIACNTMRMKSDGGLNRAVLWLDSRRNFRTERLIQVAGEMTMDRLKKKFHYSEINNLDELEYFIDQIPRERWEEVGTVIINSLILPVRNQYPLGGQDLSNWQPLRKHLIRIFRKLRNVAKRYNLMVVFTNTLKRNWERMYYGPQFVPEGEVEMEHGSDMRILIDKATSREISRFGLGRDEQGSILRAHLQNSSRIPERKGFFKIEKIGVCDPRWEEEIIFEKPKKAVKTKRKRNGK